MREHFLPREHDTRLRAARAVVNAFRVPITFASPWAFARLARLQTGDAVARGGGALEAPPTPNHFIAIPGKNR